MSTIKKRKSATKKRKSATSKKTKVSATSKRKLISTIKSTLIGKIEKANKRHKAQRVKPYYLNAQAQNLLDAISVALVSAKKMSVMSSREWYATNRTDCVVLDVRTIVTHGTENLYKRPDLTFDARLKALAKIASEVKSIGYFRYLQNGSALITPKNDDAYMVVLFRK